MPEKPLREQAKPPCVPETEVELRGGPAHSPGGPLRTERGQRPAEADRGGVRDLRALSSEGPGRAADGGRPRCAPANPRCSKWALKGPLHGGAPGPVLDMLDAIGAPERAGRRIMGMGHRIYRVRDRVDASRATWALRRKMISGGFEVLEAWFPDRIVVAEFGPDFLVHAGSRMRLSACDHETSSGTGTRTPTSLLRIVSLPQSSRRW
jgi:hypothetical protein